LIRFFIILDLSFIGCKSNQFTADSTILTELFHQNLYILRFFCASTSLFYLHELIFCKFVNLADRLVHTVHLAEIETEADDKAEEDSDGRCDESFGTSTGELISKDSCLPIVDEHPKKDERHGNEHLHTLSSLELEQAPANGQQVVATGEKSLQLSMADDVVNEFDDNCQEDDETKVP
jgi:hypothetical protein